MVWVIVEWVLEHPPLLWVTLAAIVGLFCWWLFAPLHSHHSEGSIVDEGHSFADFLSLLFDP
jgi:hypothetical protein